MVEGVLLAPVLVVLWFGIRYIADLQHASAQARLEARRCAWEHALAGCDEPPPGCSRDELQRNREQVEGAPDLRASTLAETGPLAYDPFTRVPILGAALDGLFGTTTQSTATLHVRSPFATEPVRVTARFVVLCNERPRSVAEAARSAFCAVLPICP